MINFKRVGGCFGNRGSITINFIPSQSTDVVGYMITCSESINSCNASFFDTNYGSIVVDNNQDYVVNVQAVNSFNRTSMMLQSNRITIENNHGK